MFCFVTLSIVLCCKIQSIYTVSRYVDNFPLLKCELETKVCATLLLGSMAHQVQYVVHPFQCKKCISFSAAACYQVELWLFWNAILIRIWPESFFRILLGELIWLNYNLKIPGSRGVVAWWLQGVIHCRCPIAVQAQQAYVDLVFVVRSFQAIHFHSWNFQMSKQIVAPRRIEAFNIQCFPTRSTTFFCIVSEDPPSNWQIGWPLTLMFKQVSKASSRKSESVLEQFLEQVLFGLVWSPYAIVQLQFNLSLRLHLQ